MNAAAELEIELLCLCCWPAAVSHPERQSVYDSVTVPLPLWFLLQPICHCLQSFIGICCMVDEDKVAAALLSDYTFVDRVFRLSCRVSCLSSSPDDQHANAHHGRHARYLMRVLRIGLLK